MGSRASGEDSSVRRCGMLARLADRIALALAAAFALVLAFLALNRPWVSDDFSSAVFLRNHPAVWDFVASAYATWTGRFVGSAFAWLTLQVRPVYGAVIWLGIVLLVVLTFALARARFPRFVRADLYLVAFIAVAYWYGLPAIEETVFWTAGSSVYLWPAVAGLAFLYPYRRWGEGVGAEHVGALRRLAAALGMFALGVAVGGSQEQLLAASVVYLGILGLRSVRAKRHIPVHLYAGVLGLVAAGAISLSAPGNGVRLEAVPETGLGGTAVAAAKFLVHMGVEWLPPIAPWLVLVALLSVPLARLSGEARDTDWSGVRSDWWAWMLLGFATISPFLVQPYFGAERTVMFVAVFLAVAVVSLGSDDRSERLVDRIPAPVASAVVALLLLITVGDVALSALQARSLTAGQRTRAEHIERQKKAGIIDVTVRPISNETPRRGVIWGDGTADPEFWVNDVMAGWYEVRTVTVSDDALASPCSIP